MMNTSLKLLVIAVGILSSCIGASAEGDSPKPNNEQSSSEYSRQEWGSKLEYCYTSRDIVQMSSKDLGRIRCSSLMLVGSHLHGKWDWLKTTGAEELRIIDLESCTSCLASVLSEMPSLLRLRVDFVRRRTSTRTSDEKCLDWQQLSPLFKRLTHLEVRFSDARDRKPALDERESRRFLAALGGAEKLSHLRVSGGLASFKKYRRGLISGTVAAVASNTKIQLKSLQLLSYTKTQEEDFRDRLTVPVADYSSVEWTYASSGRFFRASTVDDLPIELDIGELAENHGATLSRLSLFGLHLKIDSGLELWRKFKALDSVDIRDSVGISPSVLLSVDLLAELGVGWQESDNKRNDINMLNALPGALQCRLRSLAVMYPGGKGSSFADSTLPNLKNIENLRCLTILQTHTSSPSKCSAAVLKVLSCLASIEALTIDGFKISEKHWHAVGDLVRLSTLELPNTTVNFSMIDSNEGGGPEKKLPCPLSSSSNHLSRFHLEMLLDHESHKKYESFIQALLSRLGKDSKLEHLEIAATPRNATTKLSELKLPQLSSKDIAHIGNVKSLRVLKLRWVEARLAHLAKALSDHELETLELLNLKASPLTAFKSYCEGNAHTDEKPKYDFPVKIKYEVQLWSTVNDNSNTIEWVIAQGANIPCLSIRYRLEDQWGDSFTGLKFDLFRAHMREHEAADDLLDSRASWWLRLEQARG